MPLNPETRYPTRRTYVLKLRSDAVPGALIGRLENVVTGRQWDFANEQDLVESIERDVSASSDERVSGGSL